MCPAPPHAGVENVRLAPSGACPTRNERGGSQRGEQPGDPLAPTSSPLPRVGTETGAGLRGGGGRQKGGWGPVPKKLQKQLRNQREAQQRKKAQQEGGGGDARSEAELFTALVTAPPPPAAHAGESKRNKWSPQSVQMPAPLPLAFFCFFAR